MEILIKSLKEERKRFSEQMEDEQQAQREQLSNMVTASIKQAEDERKAFIKQREDLNAQMKKMQEYNEENMKKIKQMSDVTARQNNEEDELLQRIKRETKEDKEALIKEVNDKHEQEMKAFRDEMNAKLNEVSANAAKIGSDLCRTPGAIIERTKTANELHDKTKATLKARQEVEKPGVLKTVMKFVSGVVPAAGATVAAFCPPSAPIVVPITSLVGAGAAFVADNICSIL